MRFCTANAIGRMSSEAIGATTTPPITTPVAGRQKIFTKPRRSSDIFALGGVAYYCLTGRTPFEGSNILALLTAKEKGTFVPASRRNPEVPPTVDKMISKLLAKMPEHRYQSAGEFIQDAEWGGFKSAPIEL